MKTLVFNLLFASVAFAQTVFQEQSKLDQLKSYYDAATTPAVLEDFADVDANPKVQVCAYWDLGKKRMMGLTFGKHRFKWTDGSPEEEGPLFPAKEKLIEGLVWKSRNFQERESDMAAMNLSSDGIDLVWNFPPWDNTLRFRKGSEYIFFRIVYSKLESYGYCWSKK